MALRTAVIGAGIVSENNHLPSLDRNPRTDLAAVCDLDREAAREAASGYGCTAYADVDRLLESEPLDWIHVATPVQTHASRNLLTQITPTTTEDVTWSRSSRVLNRSTGFDDSSRSNSAMTNADLKKRLPSAVCAVSFIQHGSVPTGRSRSSGEKTAVDADNRSSS